MVAIPRPRSWVAWTTWITQTTTNTQRVTRNFMIGIWFYSVYARKRKERVWHRRWRRKKKKKKRKKEKVDIDCKCEAHAHAHRRTERREDRNEYRFGYTNKIKWNVAERFNRSCIKFGNSCVCLCMCTMLDERKLSILIFIFLCFMNEFISPFSFEIHE